MKPRTDTKITKFGTEEAIWQSLEKELKHKIAPCVRDYYKEKRLYIIEVLENPNAYIDLKEDLEGLLKCVADLPGPPQGTRHGQKETSIAGDRRARLLSKIWANVMNQDPGVQKFRDEHLEGKTLQSFDDVDRWLDIQAFGEEQWYDDKQPGVIGPSWETIMQESILGFYDPRMRIDEAMPENPDHKALIQLRKLAYHLTFGSPWSKGQATWFILTGQAPQTYMLASTVYHKGRDTTIVMHISPRTSPDDVLRVYRGLRKDLLIQQRDRDLSEKKLRLVEFVMENPDKSDHDLHLEWNRSRYPKDQYEQLESFNKAIEIAETKIFSNDIRRPFEPNVTHEEWERLLSESARIAAERAQQSGESGDAKS